MPRPCAVESHAGSSKTALSLSSRCHGLAPWSLTLVAQKPRSLSSRCHGLAPWSLTFAPAVKSNYNALGTSPMFLQSYQPHELHYAYCYRVYQRFRTHGCRSYLPLASLKRFELDG